jgi:type I restriction enzyme S subunit
MNTPWISSYMPDHWQTLRAKNMFTKQNRPIRDEDDVVTCFRDGAVTLRKNRRTTGFTESTQWSGYQGIRKGDLVIHVMDAFAGAIGVSDSDGKSTPVYSVCTPKLDINNHYYAYLMREMARTGFIQSLYRGIRERSSDFRFEVFAGLFLPLPPRAEQDQIVRFLDWKVLQVNKLINAKRRQIELLEEQKRAAVNEAVTKGGDGWKDVSLGNLGSFRKGYGGSRSDDAKTGGVACVRYGDIYRSGVLFLFEPITRITEEASVNYARVCKDEMLFALSGETKEEIGQVLVNRIDENTWTSGDTAIFTANMNLLPRFLTYALRCPYVVEQRASMAKGDIIVHISTGALRRLRILVPPIDEQESIANDLDKRCTAIEQAVQIENEQIILFTEYRTRLISDVVTGKLDVRGITVPEYEVMEATVETEEIEEETC